MEILIVSATAAEIEPVEKLLNAQWIGSSPGTFTRGNCTVRLLVSGIGMHRMAFTLGQVFTSLNPGLCINIGMAGAFPGRCEIGEVVHVTSERIIDLGAEDGHGRFLGIAAMDLDEDISSISGLLNKDAAQYSFLRSVKGITANTSHGSSDSIQVIVKDWEPDVESMEGAAFFYCCMKANVPFLEIRAISNLVEPRNKANWNIPLALNNLSSQIIEILNFFVS